MAKKKRQPGLPRVTLLAYNRRDLLAFTEAVEQMRHLVADMMAIRDEINRRIKKPAAPAAAPVTPPIPGM